MWKRLAKDFRSRMRKKKRPVVVVWHMSCSTQDDTNSACNRFWSDMQAVWIGNWCWPSGQSCSAISHRKLAPRSLGICINCEFYLCRAMISHIYVVFATKTMNFWCKCCSMNLSRPNKASVNTSRLTPLVVKVFPLTVWHFTLCWWSAFGCRGQGKDRCQIDDHAVVTYRTYSTNGLRTKDCLWLNCRVKKKVTSTPGFINVLLRICHICF